jgi:lipopolysaccharide export system permease protein
MTILSRHIVRAMLGPFLFAVSALTGILFLNAVAEEMEDLSGKGLEWQVIAEFMVLTLPHTLALTLPMAVLVAVLHAFSEMTSANEITAMKAGGISPGNILRPLLGVGMLAAATVYVFNDQILPEANHRLSNLLQDINRKSPTLVLKEQAVNRLEAGEDRRVFHLVAREIDNRTSTLKDVRVVDQNDPRRRTITWADSAWIQFSPNQTDLYMTLYDGVSLQTSEENRAVFDRSEFSSQQLQFAGVGDEFERGQSDIRNERELTVADLRQRARSQDEQREALVTDTRGVTVDAVRGALGYEVGDSAMAAAMQGTANAMRTAYDIFGRTGAEGAPLVQYDRMTNEVQRRTSGAAAGYQQHVLNAREYRVEVHKKAALAFACIVFVILGAPLAARFPNGGLGLVIGASTVIFSIYWMGLIGGEKLAEPGYVPPWVAMWGTNAIFLALGALMYARMGRETSTTRGGAFDELWWKVGRLFRSRQTRAEEGAA